MLNSFSPQFFKRLQQLKINTRKSFLGSRQGMHISHRHGHGLEFADYRPYTPGDDFRHIDWGVYGRTDRIYIRRFRDEQDLNIVFLVDGSASMGFPEGQGKFEFSKNLTLALSYVALSDGDTVTISILGQKNLPKYNGAKSLTKASLELDKITAQGSFHFPTEIKAATARTKLPSRCFLVSDFLFDTEEQFEALQHLLSRNFEVSVIQILSPLELALGHDGKDSLLLVDSETNQEMLLNLDNATKKEYQILLNEHTRLLKDYCEQKGIGYLLVSSAEAIEEFVLNRLPEIGLLK